MSAGSKFEALEIDELTNKTITIWSVSSNLVVLSVKSR